MTVNKQSMWDHSLLDPSSQRIPKPRGNKGVTMLMDKGLGSHSFADLLHTSADYIDYIKLGFGTTALYPLEVLQSKISMARASDVELYPGGSFFEAAYAQGKMEHYFEVLQALGFQTLEISDGTIDLMLKERSQAIKVARSQGFKVITECGKKLSGSKINCEEVKELLLHDLEYGAQAMIIEGRESGSNVGLYKATGELDQQELLQICEQIGKELLPFLIWEAPQRHQQISLIKHFGVHVNLGNIAAEEIYSLEALRRGLRSDTMLDLIKSQIFKL